MFWLSAFISNSMLSFLLTAVPAFINIFIQANHAKFCHNKYTFPSLAQNMRKRGEILRCILLGKEKFRTLPPKKNVNLNKILKIGGEGIWKKKISQINLCTKVILKKKFQVPLETSSGINCQSQGDSDP